MRAAAAPHAVCAVHAGGSRHVDKGGADALSALARIAVHSRAPVDDAHVAVLRARARTGGDDCVPGVAVFAPTGNARQSLADNGIFIVKHVTPLDTACRHGQAASAAVGVGSAVLRLPPMQPKRRECAAVACVGAEAACQSPPQHAHGHGERDVRALLHRKRGLHLHSREDCPDVWVVESVEMEMENDELDSSAPCCCRRGARFGA